jgi:hypothetical protein
MSTTPTPPSPPSGSLADAILFTLDALLTATGTLIPFGQYADLLVKIAQKGVLSYEAHTGKPIDPTLLKPIDPIP